MASTSGARALQQSIANLRGVRGAVVETDQSGRLTIRVLVVPERAADEVLSQVIAHAREVLGEDVSPDQVLVLGPSANGTPAGGRRMLSSLTVERTKDGFRAKVALALNGDILMGEIQAPPGTDDREVVAGAVLQALSDLIEGEPRVVAVETVPIGKTTMGVVTVTCDGSQLTGSAVLKTDIHDTIARATLQALNRYVTRMP